MKTLHILKRQFTLLREKGKGYLLGILALHALCSCLQPLVLVLLPKLIIDGLTHQTSISALLGKSGLLCALSLCMSAVKTKCYYVLDDSFINIRQQEIAHINKVFQRIKYENLENSTRYDEIEAAMNGVLEIEGLFTGYMGSSNCLSYAFSVLLQVLVLWLYQPLIALLSILCALLSVWLHGHIAKVMEAQRQPIAKAKRQKDVFHKTFFDYTYGKDLRIFQLRPLLLRKYREKSQEYEKGKERVERKELTLKLFGNLVEFLQMLGSYLLIIFAYIQHSLSLGDVVMLAGIAAALSAATRELIKTSQDLIKSTRLTERYFAFCDNTVLFEKQTGSTLSTKEGVELCLDHVSFSYPGSTKEALKDVSLTIHNGEKLAIVGKNGAGKSTLVKLITRLYSPTSGRILWNGVNIEDIALREYRKRISVVFQDIHVYACSLLENITGCESGGDRAKAQEALRFTGLSDAAALLPKKEDTMMLKALVDDGIELSGGQKQKLAIARALYKEGDLMILDEPTASLDAFAEQEIYEQFQKLTKGKTTIFISHRLASTRLCDKIAFFDEQGLAEYGSHEELMAARKEYYRLFMLQGKYYQEGKTHGEEEK